MPEQTPSDEQIVLLRLLKVQGAQKTRDDCAPLRQAGYVEVAEGYATLTAAGAAALHVVDASWSDGSRRRLIS